MIERWVLIEEDAELPENPYIRFPGHYPGEHPSEEHIKVKQAFFQGQQSMLDAGFRKVKEAGQDGPRT